MSVSLLGIHDPVVTVDCVYENSGAESARPLSIGVLYTQSCGEKPIVYTKAAKPSRRVSSRRAFGIHDLVERSRTCIPKRHHTFHPLVRSPPCTLTPLYDHPISTNLFLSGHGLDIVAIVLEISGLCLETGQQYALLRSNGTEQRAQKKAMKLVEQKVL